jgi:hypothetical protein
VPISAAHELVHARAGLTLALHDLRVDFEGHRGVECPAGFDGSGTRMYKGWKGSGRWASFDEKKGYADHYFVRWEGLVTR